jgi:hypothetical protein
LAVLIVAGFITFVIIDTSEDRDRLRSILGMITLLSIAFLLSKHRFKV